MHEPVAAIFVASGLDGRTHPRMIHWFANKSGESVVIGLVERCDDSQRQEALEAGASCVCSKPEFWSHSCGVRPSSS